MTPHPMLAATMLAALLLAAPASAQPPGAPPPTPAGVDREAVVPAPPGGGFLSLTLELDRLDSGTDGGGGAVAWVRRGERVTVITGLSSFELGDNRWTYGRLGAATELGAGTYLDGEARLGFGDDGASYDYRLAEVGLTRRLGGRVYLRLADQVLEIDRAHGNLVKPSLRLHAGPRLALGLGWVRSTGGNLDTDVVSGRVDLAFGRWGVLLGYATGRSRSELYDLRTAGAGDLDQAFAGLKIPAGRFEWLLTVDRLRIDDAERDTFSLTFKIPRPTP